MEFTLLAKPRSVFGKQNKKLRRNRQVPAILYGKGKESLALELGEQEFIKIFRQAGESSLINLKIEGSGERKVLVHEVARHYMKDEPIHVDFYEVDLTKKIHAKVPIHFIGAAPAVKELGGIMLKNLSEIEVEALPQDLPQFLEVSTERLKTFNDVIRLSELVVPQRVKILGHLEEVIVSVQAPRSEEELAELEKPTGEQEKAAIEGMVKQEEAEKAAKASVAGEAALGDDKAEPKLEEKKDAKQKKE